MKDLKTDEQVVAYKNRIDEELNKSLLELKQLYESRAMFELKAKLDVFYKSFGSLSSKETSLIPKTLKPIISIWQKTSETATDEYIKALKSFQSKKWVDANNAIKEAKVEGTLFPEAEQLQREINTRIEEEKFLKAQYKLGINLLKNDNKI
jgi:hypothetical protein